ncbi:hypothetical protein WSM22_31360 [Cytophagales bacterium WSM2-2]|nr:hypothetical protein WSM22_31360 [Cytophagales bacterium WSM2-2]
MKNYLLFGLIAIYVLWTLKFVITFNKTDIYFNKGQKIIHNILIWLIPFIWIIIIKTITKATPGSANYNKTKGGGTFSESGLGLWGDGDNSSSEHTDHH